MKKQLQLRILSDGTIVAETVGIKGSQCTDYLELIEKLLQAKTVISSFTEEYYQTETTSSTESVFLNYK